MKSKGLSMSLSHALHDGEGVAFGVDGLCNPSYAGDLLFPGMDEKGAIKNHPDALKQAFLAGQRLVEG